MAALTLRARLASQNANKLAELRAALPGWQIEPIVAEGWPEETEQITQMYRNVSSQLTTRTTAQVREIFDGWQLVEPGVVQIARWRPDPGSPPPPESMAWSGLARKAS